MNGLELENTLLRVRSHRQKQHTFQQTFINDPLFLDLTIAKQHAKVRFKGMLIDGMLVNDIKNIYIQNVRGHNAKNTVTYSVLLEGQNIFAPQLWNKVSSMKASKIYRIELIALPEQPAFIEADNIDAVAQYVIYSGEDYGTSEQSIWKMIPLSQPSEPFIVINVEKAQTIANTVANYCYASGRKWSEVIIK